MEAQPQLQPQPQQFQHIYDFLEGLTFRREMFGANTEDVHACMQDLNAMYQDALYEQKLEQQKTLDTLRQQIQEKDRQIAILKTALEKGKAAHQAAYDAYCKAQEQLKQYALREQKYREQFERMSRMIDQLQRDKETIIAQAKKEVGAFAAAVSNKSQQQLRYANTPAVSGRDVEQTARANQESAAILARANKEASAVVAAANQEAHALVARASSDAEAFKMRARQQMQAELQKHRVTLEEIEQAQSHARDNLALLHSYLSGLTEEIASLQVKVDNMAVETPESAITPQSFEEMAENRFAQDSMWGDDFRV